MIEKVLTPLSLKSFMDYMPRILDHARGKSGIEGREFDRRGYLTLMDGITGNIVFTIPFGEIPEEKRQKYFELSQEKAMRLFSQVNMHLPNGHTTSFQSRNEENEQYGGAIYVNCHSTIFILSFSGMPELIDEAMMLVLAEKLSRSVIHKSVKAPTIEACERNPFWKSLLKDFDNSF